MAANAQGTYNWVSQNGRPERQLIYFFNDHTKIGGAWLRYTHGIIRIMPHLTTICFVLCKALLMIKLIGPNLTPIDNSSDGGIIKTAEKCQKVIDNSDQYILNGRDSRVVSIAY